MTEAARLVRESTVPMGEAEIMLQDRELDDALPPQDAALLILAEAIAQLAALDEAVAQQELQRATSRKFGKTWNACSPCNRESTTAFRCCASQ